MSPFAGLYSQGDERKCRSSEPPIFKKWVEKNPDFTYGSGFFKISLEPHVTQKSTLYPQKLDKIIFPMVCDPALYVKRSQSNRVLDFIHVFWATL